MSSDSQKSLTIIVGVNHLRLLSHILENVTCKADISTPRVHFVSRRNIINYTDKIKSAQSIYIRLWIEYIKTTEVIIFHYQITVNHSIIKNTDGLSDFVFTNVSPFQNIKMSSWTPRHSVFLSQLLDVVIGTQYMVEIRKDQCRLIDCGLSGDITDWPSYFTGSKSEGLDLPESDVDYMRDGNKTHDILIVQQDQSLPQLHKKRVWEMVTDFVQPAFAKLRSLTPDLEQMPCMVDSMRFIDGFYFLSSHLFTVNHIQNCGHKDVKKQGPSMEHKKDPFGPYRSETDIVISFHCPFWPKVASEWISRSRTNCWPEIDVINKIVSFGFHLVPIGHPRSSTHMMEWRLSFSVAEKLLVWSFNHTQIQMYAILKLILKEVIKANCSAENNVLCSYFMKTYLFWKFEETDKGFWRPENLRECLRYLLVEFHKVLQCGILKHYFIPSFNLLEVKLTRNAQLELLQLYDMLLQYDIKIIQQCRTLRKVWEEFSFRMGYSEFPQQCLLRDNCLNCEIPKRDFIMNSKYMMDIVHELDRFRSALSSIYTMNTNEAASTPLGLLVFGRCRIANIVFVNGKKLEWPSSNRNVYNLERIFGKCGVNLATGQLWIAILYLIKGNFSKALDTISKLLSSIPPYALHFSKGKIVSKPYVQMLYVDMFLNSGLDFLQISKRAWLYDFWVPEDTIRLMPAAVQIEIDHAIPKQILEISPFTLAYYLQFLCHHGLRQFDNRDHALRQLVEVANNPEQYGCDCIRHHAYNIAGHCLWFIGETARARQMFITSLEVGPPKYNSASYYLQHYAHDIDIDVD